MIMECQSVAELQKVGRVDLKSMLGKERAACHS